jgi:hypothetical protein
MRRFDIVTAVAAVVASLCAGGAARAADDASEVDIRCLVVGGAMAGSQDPDVQSLGRATLFYFAGRLDGRNAGANLKARVAETADKMTAADIQAQIPVCSGLFTAANQTLQDISDTLREHAAPPPPPANAAEPPK